MRIRILGSSAGGGLPQWNCACANCVAARRGSPSIRPRLQSSVAVSADGIGWFLLNVSADVRQQLQLFDDLGPHSAGIRSTSIVGCILTDAELDHTSGLLQLREGCDFSVWSTAIVRRWLNDAFPIERLMAPFCRRPWRELPLQARQTLALADGSPSGLEVKAIETGRGAPRYVAEEESEAEGAVIGLEIYDIATGGKFTYLPGVAAIDSHVERAALGAQLLLFDGTFWSDDELGILGISHRTALQMGHLPVSGSQGSLTWIASLPVRDRVYIHINNTNPMLDEESREHALVLKCGVQIGMDRQEFVV